ncbi:MAG: hypothetical protein FJX77_12840, partial [Armatimonadetes bacterium]|nr:hypothetical protein [Armatimonadota bacterium]
MRTSLPLFGVGLFALGLYAFSFASEVPQGTLSGVILSKETGRPLPEVRVVARPVAAAEPKSATAASPGEPVTTRTDAAGQFRFRGIPAGNYELEPQTEAHVNTEMPAVVREADETRVRMELPGRDPFLNLHIHQRAYLPGEKPRLELHGFRQGDSLRLRLYSTRLQALLPAWGSDLARLLAPTATTSRPGTLPALQSRGISLAREWGFAVRKRDAEGVFYADEWVADVLPGLYLVTATGARTQAVGWLVVTDLALVTKSAGNTTLCYATHLKTGQPVPGVRVSQYRGERQAASGTTNAQGLVELRSAGTSGEEGSEGAFFGHRGDSVAFMRFYSGSEEVDRYRVHTYTDRPVYRPGHRVAFKGVARRRHGADYSLPDVRFVELRVLGPQETEIYTASVPVNPRGSFAGEFTIPTEAAAGLYSLEVEIAGEVHENTLA